MKFSIKMSDLIPAIDAAANVVPSNNPMAILKGVRVSTGIDQIVIFATDLERCLELRVPAAVEREGDIIVPATVFRNLLKRLPDKEVTIVHEEDNIRIAYGKNSTTKLNVFSAEDFPLMDEPGEMNKIVLTGGAWKSYIEKVLFAAAPANVRPNYAGVRFEVEGGNLTMVATDTYRVSLVGPIPVDTADTFPFVPSATLSNVVSLVRNAGDDNVEMTWNEMVVCFKGKNFTLISRLIDQNQFPDYKKVIPKGNPEATATLSMAAFASVLERAMLFKDSIQNAVIELSVQGETVKVRTESGNGSLFEEIIPDSITGESSVLCTTQFLLDPFKEFGAEKVQLEMNGSRGMIVVKYDNAKCLVLPVRKVSDLQKESPAA